MTNEEALETLLDNAENGCVDIEEVKLVFAELQNNSDEDCISRKDLIEYANNLKDGIGITANDIARFPSIQTKTGHWMEEITIYGWDEKSYQCSCCGRSIHLDTVMEDLEDYPYCHCGARMIELQESEEV